MKFAASTITIALLSALATWVMPWWMIAVVALAVSFTFQLSAGKAFLSGFLGIVLFWLVAIVMIDTANEHILSERMAKLFGLSNYWLFILVDLLVGGVVGGVAAWSGAIMRNTFMKPQS
jgi:hypothetical protein